MPSDELDPKLEAATQEFISVSKNISDAIAIEARGSARFKNSIAISLDWPARLPKHPLREQIAAHIAADRKIGARPSGIVPNEVAALSFYRRDFLSACNVTVGNFLPHGAALLESRTQRSIVRKVLDALLPESDLDPNTRPEIPGIDLKRAAGLIRYGVAHRVDGLKIVFWLQQELAYDVIFQEVTAGGVPANFPADPEGPELGGYGARIAEVIRHGIDSDFGLDLTRIANWMETGRWPLESSPGEIFTMISEQPAPKNRVSRPHVELSWLFGLTRGLQEWRKALADALTLQLQLLSDLAIMRPPEFESESEILEAAATPAPAADPPATRIPAEKIAERAVAQERTEGKPALLSKPLSKRLQKGKECEERAQEIATIRRLVRAEGMTIHEVRLDHPGFGIWELVQALPKEWQDTFAKPMEWGPAKGFANNLLAEFKNRRPSTVDGWRKAWRAWREHEGSSSKAGSSRDRKAS
jgi:hypothetical protein